MFLVTFVVRLNSFRGLSVRDARMTTATTSPLRTHDEHEEKQETENGDWWRAMIIGARYSDHTDRNLIPHISSHFFVSPSCSKRVLRANARVLVTFVVRLNSFRD